MDDGRITDAGYAGRGYISRTRSGWGPQRELTVQPAEFPQIRTEPEITATGARFSQTTGGRTSAPMPRPVSGKPYFQWLVPTVWTTLALTIGTDGSARGEMTGASPFPRHWIYDQQGKLIAKSGLADFREWMRTAHGQHSPWGQQDSPPLVAVAESALERQLSATIMRGGAKPAVRKLAKGRVLTEHGMPGDTFTCCSTGCSAWRWTALKSASSAPARSWGNAPCWRMAAGPPPCALSPAASLPPPPRIRSTGTSSPASPNCTAGKSQTAERHRGNTLAHNKAIRVRRPPEPSAQPGNQNPFCPAVRVTGRIVEHGG